ncbi:hypothetical protein [Nocardia brasiliensis]|uniref:hypothetical protein n=1 Tax=Nocardia brasiliensis TaxID=37326 RepID=UPI0024559ADB|nr:hypothetical protein [Nocardia brasiliensis]
MPPAQPREFRERAIELVRAGGRPIGQVASSLRSSESCLQNWLEGAEIDDGVHEGPTSADAASWSSCGAKPRVLGVSTSGYYEWRGP